MKEGRKLAFPVLWEPIKPRTGLVLLTKAQDILLLEVLKARVDESWLCWHQRISQRGEREKERKSTQTQASGVSMFIDLSWVYRSYYTRNFNSDKDQKPNVQQLLSREQGLNNGHKVRKQLISVKEGRTKQFFGCGKRMLLEGNPGMFHPDSQSWSSMLPTHSCQELIRNGGLRESRKQHTENPPKLNIPWTII